MVSDLLKIYIFWFGCWLIAYEDDVVLMVKGYPNVVACWAKRTGLAVNPYKTEIQAIYNPGCIPSLIWDTRLYSVEKVKYLGLIHNRKISRKPNFEKRMRKALVALFCYKETIVKR